MESMHSFGCLFPSLVMVFESYFLKKLGEVYHFFPIPCVLGITPKKPLLNASKKLLCLSSFLGLFLFNSK